MSIKDRLAAKSAHIGTTPRPPGAKEPSEARMPKTAPGQLMSSLPFLAEKEREIEQLERKLKQLEESSPTHEIPLEKLFEAVGRRRNLSSQEFAELRENLRHNELVTPITVRRREDDTYEIISGHNRVSAFRELGRTSILAVVSEADGAQADINAFYANLLQPSLPDYEKYLGFCMIKERRPDLSHEAIADMTGLSRSQVTKLMAFAALPAEAHEVLRNHVSAVGASAAQDLANLAKLGKAQQVVEAIARIAAGDLDQAQAVRFAGAAAKEKAAKPETIKIKSGKSVFCELRRADKVIRLSFKTAEEAEDLESAIREVLEQRARQKKPET
jgi:ParB family chromosome partitioning protein